MRALLLGWLRMHWLEYLVGASAIATVMAALLAQRSVAASADAAVHDLAHRLGKNMLVLPAETDAAGFHRQQYGRAGIDGDAPRRIRASPLAQHVGAMQAQLYGHVAVGGAPGIVVGEDGGWPEAPVPGTVPAIAGGEVARRLRLGAGSLLDVGGVRLSVSGIADPAPEGLDEALFVPLAAAQAMLGRQGQINALRLAGCWCRLDIAALATEVEKLLPGTRAVTVAGVIRAQKGAIATMERYSGWIGAAGIALVAGMIVGLVSSQVRRRSRELGLLAAVGAPPGRIAAAFALQAAAAGAIGGLGGWLAAIPLTRHLSERILGTAATPSPGLLLPAVVLCALGSGAVALLPAGRAASLDPTVVLRET